MMNNSDRNGKDDMTFLDTSELRSNIDSNNTTDASKLDLEDYKAEYEKIQEDINTLRLVLNEKLKREHELKLILGISFVDEIKQDFQESFNQIKQTTVFQTLSEFGTSIAQNDTYQKTTAGLKNATQKITPAFQTFGSTVRNKLGDMRNSAMFKSVEGTLTNVTGKMKNSKSEYGVDSTSDAGSNASIPSSNTMQNVSTKVQEPIEEKVEKK